MLYKMAFELIEKITYKKNGLIFNDAEYLEKYHYIEMKIKEGTNTRNFKNRLENKINIFEFMKRYMPGFIIILNGNAEI
jgi:hypothetical protein